MIRLLLQKYSLRSKRCNNKLIQHFVAPYTHKVLKASIVLKKKFFTAFMCIVIAWNGKTFLFVENRTQSVSNYFFFVERVCVLY